MAWKSMTGQFETREVRMLEADNAAELIQGLLESDPLVALRALAEVMLNGDEKKLREVLADPAVVAHWQQYVDDDPDERDKGYAAQLKALLS